MGGAPLVNLEEKAKATGIKVRFTLGENRERTDEFLVYFQQKFRNLSAPPYQRTNCQLLKMN